MKILFWQWSAFMQKGMEKALTSLKMEYEVFYYQPEDWEKEEAFSQALKKRLIRGDCDVVLSVNYAPVVSEVCEALKIKYISWVYDSPVHIRDISSFRNSCNQISFFDRGQAEYYRAKGYEAAKHLPLAADEEVWTFQERPEYACDVAFVGQLYQSDYGYLMGPLDQYYRGLLEGYVASQEKVSGGYILEDLISGGLLEKLNQYYQKASKGTFKVNKAELAYACACEVTGRERFKALALLSNRYELNLYSQDKDERLAKVRQRGYVDYYTQMPAVFRQAKINLNISLRTIRTGIPLRVLDIMSCGGFVITNYQEELMEYFVPGEDLVIYEDMKDLVLKAAYYLEHEQERKEISQRGRKKVAELFRFEDRIKQLFEN